MTLESEVLIRSLADAALVNRYHEIAVHLLRRATQRSPGNQSYHYRLGRLLVDQYGAYDEAYGPLLRAVSGERADSDALMTLGYVQRKLHRYDDAIRTYERALRLRPDSAEALTDFGAALSGAQRYGDAVSAIRQADSLSGDKDRTQWRQVLLADALFWIGHAKAALEVLGTARDPRQPWDENVLCGIATAWHALGERKEAARACGAVVGPFVCACAMAMASPSPENTLPTFTERDGTVAAAALRAESEYADARSTLLVVEDVSQFGLLSSGTSARESIVDRLTRGSRGQSPQVLEALHGLTSEPHVPKRVAITAPRIRVVTATDIRDAFAGEGPPFYKRFPGANGFTTISSPVYSKDQSAAVIFVQRTAQLDQHPGALVALKRTDDTWETVGIIHASSVSGVGR